MDITETFMNGFIVLLNHTYTYTCGSFGVVQTTVDYSQLAVKLFGTSNTVEIDKTVINFK